MTENKFSTLKIFSNVHNIVRVKTFRVKKKNTGTQIAGNTSYFRNAIYLLGPVDGHKSLKNKEAKYGVDLSLD